jgi:small redox-active disulfide protein 2
MKIEIFGVGCPKCRATEANARKAVQELGVQAEVVPIYDKATGIKRGITDNPSLLIDGKLKVSGRIAEVEEIKAFIRA